MKTQQILAVVFSLLVATASFTSVQAKGGSGGSADAQFAYSVRAEKGTNKIVLSFDNLSKKKVSIKIYDESSRLVLKETQHDTQELRKRYDLSKLGKGTYTVKIASGSDVFTEEIEVGKANELDFETVVAPDALQNNKLRVGFANATSAVSVVITNSAGNEVYTESFSNVQTANYLFNMEKLRKGVYQVKITTNGKQFTEEYIVD